MIPENNNSEAKEMRRKWKNKDFHASNINTMLNDIEIQFCH
jgi:hypothetical protein